jgi:hypothetical protein
VKKLSRPVRAEDGCDCGKRHPDIRFTKAAKGRSKNRAFVSNNALFPFCLHGFYEPEQAPTMKESINTTMLDSDYRPANALIVRWGDGSIVHRPRQLVMGICPS